MNNKGFTLIELLAVIVILAIIALVATPMILGVVQDSKGKALETNMKNYARALDEAVIIGQMGISQTTTEITSKVYSYNEIDNINGVTFTGEAPSEGWVAFDSRLKIVAGMLYFEKMNSTKYVVFYEGETKIVDYTETAIGENPASVTEAINLSSAIINS